MIIRDARTNIINSWRAKTEKTVSFSISLARLRPTVKISINHV